MNSKEFKQYYRSQIDFAINYLGIKSQVSIKCRNNPKFKIDYFLTRKIIIVDAHTAASETIFTTGFLFHELIHWKQCELGWLKFDSERQLFFWKKRNWKRTECRGFTMKEPEDYINSPWERQAKMIGQNMVDRFFREM